MDRAQRESRRGTKDGHKLCQHHREIREIDFRAYLVVLDDVFSHNLERREDASVVDTPIRIRMQCQGIILTVHIEMIVPVRLELFGCNPGLSLEEAEDSDSHVETRSVVNEELCKASLELNVRCSASIALRLYRGTPA